MKRKVDKIMENTFLAKVKNFMSTAFEKIAISRTKQALAMLDDRTLNDIGFTRQQVINGEFFNAKDVLNFTSDSMGLTKPVKQDNKKAETKEAA
jgi:hypothetical protein